jgi:hypothetical protein
MQQIALLTPPNCLCATHFPTVFFFAATGTKLPDDANRSIEQTYCIETAGDGPYAAVGIVACTTLLSLMHLHELV